MKPDMKKFPMVSGKSCIGILSITSTLSYRKDSLKDIILLACMFAENDVRKDPYTPLWHVKIDPRSKSQWCHGASVGINLTNLWWKKKESTRYMSGFKGRVKMDISQWRATKCGERVNLPINHGGVIGGMPPRCIVKRPGGQNFKIIGHSNFHPKSLNNGFLRLWLLD